MAAEAVAISRSARVHRVAVRRGRSERAAAKDGGTTEEGFEERGLMEGGELGGGGIIDIDDRGRVTRGWCVRVRVVGRLTRIM